MRKTWTALLALAGWFAVIGQYILLIRNGEGSLLDLNIKFFSYFTILTNIMVASYFTWLQFFDRREKLTTLTAITVYITVVGLTYQVMLRHIWDPQGLQRVVDELLHTAIPLMVIIYWLVYTKKEKIPYSSILSWLIYPLMYVIYIFVRGYSSGEYPYPFIDVDSIGIAAAFRNAGIVTLLFTMISSVYIFIKRPRTDAFYR